MPDSEKVCGHHRFKTQRACCANLLNRNFTVSAPDVVWAGDITYLRIGRKCHYLTIFIDLFFRLVVGWDLSESLERHSTIRALNKAIIRRRPDRGLMIHSDRGVQYASTDFRTLLKKTRISSNHEQEGKLLGQCDLATK